MCRTLNMHNIPKYYFKIGVKEMSALCVMDMFLSILIPPSDDSPVGIGAQYLLRNIAAEY